MNFHHDVAFEICEHILSSQGGCSLEALASKVEIFDNSFPRSFIFALNILVTIINTVYNLSINYLYKAYIHCVQRL